LYVNASDHWSQHIVTHYASTSSNAFGCSCQTATAGHPFPPPACATIATAQKRCVLANRDLLRHLSGYEEQDAARFTHKKRSA